MFLITSLCIVTFKDAISSLSIKAEVRERPLALFTSVTWYFFSSVYKSNLY